MAKHPDLPIGFRHAVHNWEYADAAARTGASGFASGDVKKLALQLDDNSLWVLTATAPTWVQVGSGVTPASHAASHGSGGGDEVTLAQSQVTDLTTDLAGKEPAQTAASQAEMEAGTEASIRSMSPLRVAQAVAARTPPTSVVIAASEIDWAVADVFRKTLAANTTFTFANSADGMTIVVALTNTASDYTVTWPTVVWPGATPPVQTVGAKTDVYTFVNINGTIYGAVSADHS